MSKAILKLDWCSHEAAKYACEHWHYSKTCPMPPLLRIGVWENSKYIGCVLFARGTNKNLGSPYGLSTVECCELVRVALDKHSTNVSRIMAIAIKLLKKSNDGVKLIVSFADPDQGHWGIVYQAGNWIYSGETGNGYKLKTPEGKIIHRRMASVSGVRPYFGVIGKVPKISECQKIFISGKHRYLYPLTQEMRDKIEPLRKPYPKPAL